MLIYLFALCKPVMPLVQDMAAHTFFEQDHLSHVHQHGGSGHVKDEVGKLAEKDSTDNTAGSVKSFDVVPFHLITTIFFCCFSFPPVNLTHNGHYLPGLSAVSLSIQLPPPRM